MFEVLLDHPSENSGNSCKEVKLLSTAKEDQFESSNLCYDNSELLDLPLNVTKIATGTDLNSDSEVDDVEETEIGMIISKTSVKNEQAVSFLQMNDIDLIVEDDDEMQEFQSSPPIQNFATFPEIQPQTNSPVSSPVSSRNGTSTTLHESDSEMKTEVPTTTPLILQDLTEISKTALVVTDSIDSDNEREDSIGFVPDLRIELTGFEELDYTRQSYENDSHYGVLSNLNVSGWWSTLKYMFCLGK